MKHNGGHETGARRPEEILAEIEHTRHEMDSTLTAIEHRLTPGQLVDQGLDYLKNSGGNEFVQNLGKQVKYNPLPVALVGIGLGWLMASSKRPPEYGSIQYGSSGDTGSSIKDSMKDKAGQAGERISNMGQSARERMSQAGERMSSMGQSARDRISQVGERVSGLGDSARFQVERARDGMDYMMREQPLALGAIGVAIGAVLAAMAPRTQKEDQLMGETRDRLMDQAKEAGKEKLEQAKEVANAAVGTATKEAENRGLKPQAGKADSDKPASQSQGATTPPVSDPFAAKPKSDPLTKPSVTSKPGAGNPGGSRDVP